MRDHSANPSESISDHIPFGKYPPYRAPSSIENSSLLSQSLDLFIKKSAKNQTSSQNAHKNIIQKDIANKPISNKSLSLDQVLQNQDCLQEIESRLIQFLSDINKMKQLTKSTNTQSPIMMGQLSTFKLKNKELINHFMASKYKRKSNLRAKNSTKTKIITKNLRISGKVFGRGSDVSILSPDLEQLEVDQFPMRYCVSEE